MKNFIAHISVYHNINISKHTTKNIKAKNKREAIIEAKKMVNNYNKKPTAKYTWKLTNVDEFSRYMLIFNQ